MVGIWRRLPRWPECIIQWNWIQFEYGNAKTSNRFTMAGHSVPTFTHSSNFPFDFRSFRTPDLTWILHLSMKQRQMTPPDSRLQPHLRSCSPQNKNPIIQGEIHGAITPMRTLSPKQYRMLQVSSDQRTVSLQPHLFRGGKKPLLVLWKFRLFLAQTCVTARDRY